MSGDTKENKIMEKKYCPICSAYHSGADAICDKCQGEKPDMVTSPPHYTQHPSGVECIQITQHMSFCVGNAVKYLWRAGLKGPPIEDMEKAVWYINKEIERLRALEKMKK